MIRKEGGGGLKGVEFQGQQVGGRFKAFLNF